MRKEVKKWLIVQNVLCVVVILIGVIVVEKTKADLCDALKGKLLVTGCKYEM